MRRSPSAVTISARPATSLGADRGARDRGLGSEQRRDRLLALFRLQRTGAIDQRPAGLEQRHRLLQQALLQRPSARAISDSCRSQATSGWRRMVPVEVQGASIRMPSKPPPLIAAEPLGGVGHHGLRLQRKPRQIVAQPRHAAGRTVDRDDTRAGMRRAARSCRRARRRDRRWSCRRDRRTGAPAARRRRPAPTIGPR